MHKYFCIFYYSFFVYRNLIFYPSIMHNQDTDKTTETYNNDSTIPNNDESGIGNIKDDNISYTNLNKIEEDNINEANNNENKEKDPKNHNSNKEQINNNPNIKTFLNNESNIKSEYEKNKLKRTELSKKIEEYKKLFKRLRQAELLIDKKSLRKKLSAEEQNYNRIKTVKRLRLYFNMEKIENKDEGVAPSFKLNINGKIVNDYSTEPSLKMTQFINSLIISPENGEFKNNNNKYYIGENIIGITEEENNTPLESENVKRRKVAKETEEKIFLEEIHKIFEWNKQKNILTGNHFEFDTFEFKINNTTNTLLKCYFEFENTQDLHKLSPKLSYLLKRKVGTKTDIIIDIWKYIKTTKLPIQQIENDKRVTCDTLLNSIFNIDSFTYKQIPILINDHLLPLDNLIIELPLDNYERTIDIILEIDDLYEFPIIYKSNDLQLLENKINEINDAIIRTEEKIDNLNKFIINPIEFINGWVLNNSKDLINGYVEDNEVEENTTGSIKAYNNQLLDCEYFKNPVVQEAIYYLLQSYK
ncbi:SWIB-domain-containing protein [Spraguea lophii 42_110]|uniref:SWIB-domain-containing protein n=1 Tax=Spraguea lophii (strain 42_110) TaxID=1358809 RepID=S7XLA2_SPRLO|nr:SWIB-domain-containing protein [Spraguea lophii 42_110]